MLLVCLLAAGCTTLGTRRQIEEARRDTESERLRVQVHRLNERVAALERYQQELGGQIEALQAADNRNATQVRDHLKTLDKTAEATGRTLSRLREEIIKDLSERIEKLLKKQSGAGRRTESGYWHTVEQGQTLSEIAKAYNVPVAAIVRANNLSNPDAIRVGTRLFIPDSRR